MNEQELEAALAFARKQGLKSITVNGITMEIGDERRTGEILTTEKDIDLAFNVPQYTEEEILYWATPYFDELQEKKKRQLETLKEDEDVRNG